MSHYPIVSCGRLITLISLSLLLTKPLMAEQSSLGKEQLVDKVITAYGGQQLTAIKSLQVTDRYKVFSLDQGANPNVNSVTRLYSMLSVDFISGKRTVKSWRQDGNGNRLSQILFDGKTGWSINHLRGTHVENSSLTADVVGAGMMRMIDTIIARRLLNNRATSSLISHSNLAGKAISTLSFKDENEAQYYIEIDRSSGLILSMFRNADRSKGPVYTYGNHKRIQGVTFATDMNMLVKGKPRFVTLSRNVAVNNLDQQAFVIPKKSNQLKGMIEPPKMKVKKLADKVYLAGEARNFSIFVDAGDFYIGGGGMSGLKKRLNAVNQFLGTNKPIKVQIIPDHHRGHLGAIKELEQMNSQILIAPQHKAIIEDLTANKSQQLNYQEVDQKIALAEGLVEVHNIQTAHAESYLLVYIPSAKLVFSADHFGTNLIESLPGANNTIKSFYQAISKLGIQVESYSHAHGPRILSHADLKNVLAGYQIEPCPTDHDICKS